MEGLTDSRAADLGRAEELAAQALALSPRNLLAHNVRGMLLRAQGRHAEAIAEYEMVLAINRSWVAAYAHLGEAKLMTGSIEEAIPLIEQAIRLSPRDHNIGPWYTLTGLVHLLQSRTDEAIVWLERARSASPARGNIRAHLASAYALNGEIERAAAELAEARRLAIDGRFSSIARVRAVQYPEVPKIRALFEATYFAGLRLAGMAEE
jgi:adenylate cyclase